MLRFPYWFPISTRLNNAHNPIIVFRLLLLLVWRRINRGHSTDIINWFVIDGSGGILLKYSCQIIFLNRICLLLV